MGLRDKVRALERMARGHVATFELRDGSRFYYDSGEVYKEVFLHGINCLEADSPEDRPEAPEVYRKMCEARDSAAVLERLTSSEAVHFPVHWSCGSFSESSWQIEGPEPLQRECVRTPGRS